VPGLLPGLRHRRPSRRTQSSFGIRIA
jgi:hypothetical protein